MTAPNFARVGDRVRFSPSPAKPDVTVEALVIRRRPGGTLGWFDTRDDEGKERSVRPTRCEVVRP